VIPIKIYAPKSGPRARFHCFSWASRPVYSVASIEPGDACFTTDTDFDREGNIDALGRANHVVRPRKAHGMESVSPHSEPDAGVSLTLVNRPARSFLAQFAQDREKFIGLGPAAAHRPSEVGCG
jgi:hypothetical protein